MLRSWSAAERISGADQRGSLPVNKQLETNRHICAANDRVGDLRVKRADADELDCPVLVQTADLDSVYQDRILEGEAEKRRTK